MDRQDAKERQGLLDEEPPHHLAFFGVLAVYLLLLEGCEVSP